MKHNPAFIPVCSKAFLLVILLMGSPAVNAEDWQHGEKILSADEAPVDAPRRRHRDTPWFTLSNVRKAEDLAFHSSGVVFDFSVEERTGFTPNDLKIVLRNKNGRHEIGASYFSPFSTENAGTVHLHSASDVPFRFGGRSPRGLMSNFPYDPLSSHFDRFNTTFDPGDFNDVEIWIELNDQYSPHLPRFKVSNSVTLGKVGQLTFAREWTKSEEADLKKIIKSRTPPVGLPDGMVRVAADTKLVPGMPIHAGWMGEWEPAEVISIMDNGLVLVKYDSNIAQALMPRTRDWIAVAPETLKIAAESPEKFKPSVSVRPGGYAVIPPNFVQVDDNTPLLPGTPLKMESGLRWEDVTLIQVTEGGNLQIKRRSPPFRHLSKDLVQRSQVMIEKVTLEKLKQPGAEQEFASLLEAAENSDSFADDNHFGFGSRGARGLRKSHYPINIPIPSSAVLLTDEMPVKVGTKLGACWGHAWYDVTVKDIDADGNLIIGWDGYSDGWDGVMDRDQLVIKKTVLAKLEENQPKKSVKTPPASSKPKDSDKPQTGERFRLVLKSHGNRKIPVTKVVVDLTGIDLKEAGEYVDSCPITLKQNLTKQAAESLRKKLESAGAEVALELQ